VTPRRPQLPRSHSGGAPTRRWLWLACLALAGAGGYWLGAEPAVRPTGPAPAPAPSAVRAEQGPKVRDRRAAPQPPRDESATPAPTLRAKPAPEERAEPSAEAAAPIDAPETDEPTASADPHSPGTAAVEPESVPAPPEVAAERAARPKPRPRRLDLTVLRRWRQPGLCARPERSSEAQQVLMSHFRAAELAAGARVFLDPRLPAGAEQPVLGYLEEAQRILQAELQLAPGVPDVFLYQDVQLLLASACTNADVVAYYDGALHIVVTRDDVRESVLHEFTHHALMTAGVIGPAWLQEGLAMHVARETWWRRPELLQRLLDRPFGLSTMETMVPYTLENDQAVLFYVQAAAMVECTTREPDSTLSGLLSELDVQQAGESLDYGLPARAELSALRECVRELIQEPPARQD
jgi:hypothetical protein